MGSSSSKKRKLEEASEKGPSAKKPVKGIKKAKETPIVPSSVPNKSKALAGTSQAGKAKSESWKSLMYPDPAICERCDKPKNSGDKADELCHDCQDQEENTVCYHCGINMADEFFDTSAQFGLPDPSG